MIKVGRVISMVSVVVSWETNSKWHNCCVQYYKREVLQHWHVSRIARTKNVEKK